MVLSGTNGKSEQHRRPSTSRHCKKLHILAFQTRNPYRSFSSSDTRARRQRRGGIFTLIGPFSFSPSHASSSFFDPATSNYLAHTPAPESNSFFPTSYLPVTQPTFPLPPPAPFKRRIMHAIEPCNESRHNFHQFVGLERIEGIVASSCVGRRPVFQVYCIRNWGSG